MSLNFSQLFPDLEKAFNDAIEGNWIGTGIDVIKGVADILGISGKSNNEIKNQLNNVQLSPDQILQLVQLQNHVVDVKEQQYLAEIADTQNARAMSIALKNPITPNILAYCLTGLFIFVMVFFLFLPIPKENIQIVNLLVGSLLGFMASLVTFWWGSSKGSEDKTNIIAGMKK